jgi:hypothetical protein
MVKKKVDARIRTLLENGVKTGHRSLFLIVGDHGRDQVVNLHYMLSKAAVKTRPSVLWCYKKELGFTSHRQKRMRKIKVSLAPHSHGPSSGREGRLALVLLHPLASHTRNSTQPTLTYEYIPSFDKRADHPRLQIGVGITGKRTTWGVSQLVMLAFHGPSPVAGRTIVVDHINHDTRCNHVHNLRYLTHSHNLINATKL